MSECDNCNIDINALCKVSGCQSDTNSELHPLSFYIAVDEFAEQIEMKRTRLYYMIQKKEIIPTLKFNNLHIFSIYDAQTWTNFIFVDKVPNIPIIKPVPREVTY